MVKTKKYSDVLKRMIIVSIIPFLLLVLASRIMSDIYLRDVFLSEHAKVVENQVTNFDEQVKQLEVAIDYFIYDIENNLNIPLEFNYQNKAIVDSTTRQLFLFENSNALVQSVKLYNLNSEEEPYYTNLQSSGNRRIEKTNSQVSYLKEIEKSGWYLINNHIQYIDFFKNNSASQGLIVIQLDEQMVKNLLTNRLATNAINFLFLDKELAVTDIKDSKTSKQTNYLELLKEEKDYTKITFDMKFINSDWQVISFYPINLVLRPLKITFDFIFIISILIMLFLAIYEYRIYNNLKHYVSEKMQQLFGDSENENSINEFEIVATNWKLLNDSKEQLEKQVESNYERLATSNLQQVLSGRSEKTSYPQIKHELQMFGVDLSGDNCLYNFIFTETIDSALNGDEDLEGILKTEFQFIFPQAILLKTSNSSFLVLQPNNKELEISIPRLMRINNLTNRYITVVKGLSFKGLENLYQHVQNLYAYRTYQRLMPKNQIIDVESFTPPILKFDVSSEEEMQNVVHQIKTSDTIDVERAYNSWLNNVLNHNDYQFFLLQEVRKLYELIRQSFPDFQQENNHETIDRLFRSLLYVFDKNTIREQVWNTIMKPVVDQYIQGNQAELELAVVQLKEYVRANYMDRNLSLDERAEQLNVDIVQLSRYFKGKMGLNYIDYLTKVRLEKAKQLLAQTMFPIKEIAESVGYEAAYFNRIFKKHFDVTPGQYRKNNQ